MQRAWRERDPLLRVSIAEELLQKNPEYVNAFSSPIITPLELHAQLSRKMIQLCARAGPPGRGRLHDDYRNGESIPGRVASDGESFNPTEERISGVRWGFPR